MRRILVCVNYYFPYVSGLSNVARDVSEYLNQQGFEVHVLCYQHLDNLPLYDNINGVKVHRVKPIFSLNRGVFSLKYIIKFLALQAKSDIIHLHSPMLEAGLFGLLSRKPKILTYHCDVSVGNNLMGRLLNKVMDYSSILASLTAKKVVVTTLDYAENSRICRFLITKKVTEIPPNAKVRNLQHATPKFREGKGVHVGFLGRIVEEKGIEYLVEGFRKLNDSNARLLIAGDFVNIAGSSIIDKVKEKIDRDERIKLLGFLKDSELNAFYKSIDVFAFTSVNSFEAFGIVQVESMMAGVPVMASNLPGVRQPVLKTKMGWIVEPKSSVEITDCLGRVFNSALDYSKFRKVAINLYNEKTSNSKYLELYLTL